MCHDKIDVLPSFQQCHAPHCIASLPLHQHPSTTIATDVSVSLSSWPNKLVIVLSSSLLQRALCLVSCCMRCCSVSWFRIDQTFGHVDEFDAVHAFTNLILTPTHVCPLDCTCCCSAQPQNQPPTCCSE